MSLPSEQYVIRTSNKHDSSAGHLAGFHSACGSQEPIQSLRARDARLVFDLMVPRGRNRTTDTRIFNSRSSATASSSISISLEPEVSLSTELQRRESA